jgi:hypothetical protein
MADETTGPDDKSKNAPATTPLINPVPTTNPGDAVRDSEPQILEETVVHKAAPQKTAPEMPAPATAPAPNPAEPPAPLSKKTEPSFVPPVQKSGVIGDDIANILKGVKLPERRDVPPAEKKPIENKAAVFDTALGASASPEEKPPEKGAPAPVPPAPVNAAEDAGKTPSSVVSVHTLKDDLQQVVHDQKISVVRAVSLEQDKRARGETGRFEPSHEPQRSKRTFGILFTVGILCVLGAGALFGVYIVMQSSSVSGPQALSNSSILFAESSVAFPIDNNQTPDDLKRALSGARTSLQGALGSITAIVPTIAVTGENGSVGSRPATFAEFVRALGAHPPDALMRALGSNFFFGIHTLDTNAPLFVIPVTSYDRAFAGMLAWESTINADLAPLFTALPATMRDENGLPVNRTFQDFVMRNYDVRELKDDAGQVRLYYSFPSQGILVIAESPYSFAEILSRLQAQREL